MVPFATKILLPSIRQDLIERRELLNVLHQRLDAKATLISAGSGYGKTTLVRQFVAELEVPVCWLTLDDSDRDPATFLQYLVHSIRRCFPGFGRGVISDAPSTDNINIRSQVGYLITELLEIGEFLVLVLDDYHEVDDSPQINEVMSLLLSSLPDNCHLLLISRTTPSLNIARLEARRQAHRLDSADLAFAPPEVQLLLNRCFDFELSLDQAADICRRYEGWAAGIVLFGMSSQPGGRLRNEDPSRHREAAFQFLVEETLERVSPETRSFLLRSSVLEFLTPQHCSLLLGEKGYQDTLESLERQNLFITRLDGDQPYFRYHSLFRELLSQLLEMRDLEAFKELQLRAGEIYEDEERWELAIEHYLTAGSMERAAQAIERHGDAFIERGQHGLVSSWLGRLPRSIQEERPRLRIVASRVLVSQGRQNEALALLNEVLSTLPPDSEVATRAQALLFRAGLYRQGGKLQEATNDCEEVLGLDGIDACQEFVAMAYGILGGCQLGEGRLSEALLALRRQHELYTEIGDRYGIASSQIDLGFVCCQLGRLKESLGYYRGAAEIWSELNNGVAEARALTDVGALHGILGEYGLAFNALDRALQMSKRAPMLPVELNVAATLGDIEFDLGNHREALRYYQGALGMAQELKEPYFLCYVERALGHVLHVTGETKEAERYLLSAKAESERVKLPILEALAEASLGCLRSEQGSQQRGLELLEKAYNTLVHVGARREQVQVSFCLALLCYRNGFAKRAREMLDQTFEAVDQMDSDWPVVVEAKRSFVILSEMTAKGFGDPRLVALLRRVEDWPILPAHPSDSAGSREPDRYPAVEARALGPAMVFLDGHLVTDEEWVSTKAKELLFLLVAKLDGYRREQIIEAIWPESDSARGSSSFHVAAFRLRQALYKNCLEFVNGRYRVNSRSRYFYDVQRYEAVTRGLDKLKGNPEALSHALEEAVRLYRGPYLEEFYADWCLPKRRELEELQISLLGRFAALLAQQGKFEEAMKICAAATEIDPLYEEAVYWKVYCLHRMGDLARALRICKEFEASLENELGNSPGGPVRDLADSILQTLKGRLTEAPP